MLSDRNPVGLRELFTPLQLALQGFMQAGPYIIGQSKKFVIAIDFDSLLRRVKQRIALVALVQMGFEGMLQFGVQLVVQIVRNFTQGLLAV
jgi:hypothetical protein